MPRRTTSKHPRGQVYLSNRTWFLEVIRTDCPKVLDDLWREVYLPLMAAYTNLTSRTLSARVVLRAPFHWTRIGLW